MTKTVAGPQRRLIAALLSVVPVILCGRMVSEVHGWVIPSLHSSSDMPLESSKRNLPSSSSVGRRFSSNLLAKATTTTTTTSKVNNSIPTSNDNISSNISPRQNLSYKEDHSPPRQVRIERYARLPVWPVWAGVILFLVGLVAGPERASKLEHYLGGRVCPMILHEPNRNNNDDDLSSPQASASTTTSPFLLLVHHNHNFWKWDGLFRSITKQFLPEGFPAHSHRGFTTLTYFLPDTGGGFIHRDSLGVRQSYGSTPRNKNFVEGLLSNGPEYDSKYEHIAQWLFTGAGLLHEEMFDVGTSRTDDTAESKNSKNDSNNSRHELYQLWVNVPSRHKMDPPRVDLLARGKDIPIITTQVRSPIYTATTKGNSPFSYCFSTRTNVAIIAGSYYDSESTLTRTSTASTLSDMNILHVTMMSTKKRRSNRNQRTGSTTPTNEAIDSDFFDDENMRESRDGISTSGSNDDDDDELVPGWTYEIPPNFDTIILYARRGSCQVTNVATSQNSKGILKDVTQTSTIPIHSTAFVEKSIMGANNSRLLAEKLIITPTNLDETVDLLILAGQPLYETYYSNNDSSFNGGGLTTSTTLEPVEMQGSMVMNYKDEIESAYRDYQLGKMGRPWDHELTDEEWLDHVRKFRCQYNYINRRRERPSDYDY